MQKLGNEDMKERIRQLLEDALPLVDATPRNLKSLDSIVAMVEGKLGTI